MRSFNGAARKVTLDEIVALAKSLNVEPAAFRAVIAVEAAGSGFDQRGRPKALFERHYFFKQLAKKPELQARAVEEGLAYVAWGMKPYPKGSDAVYAEIERACAIDDEAALLSTSWGLGQIMGANFKMAGCPLGRGDAGRGDGVRGGPAPPDGGLHPERQPDPAPPVQGLGGLRPGLQRPGVREERLRREARGRLPEAFLRDT